MTDSESSQLPEVVPKPASTVLLARDSERGIEVFMVARNKGHKFASGALVFPGGKVDPDDSSSATRECHAGVETCDDVTLGLRASAIREVFEETGILLGRHRDSGQPVNGEAAAALDQSHRAGLLAEQKTMADVAKTEDLVLSADALAWFAHWITPAARPIRFDTHFYLAQMPAGQAGAHDGDESVDSVWILARDAENEIRDKGFSAMFPTMLNLEMLAESATVSEALAATESRPVVPVIPVVQKDANGVKMVTIPANAGYKTTSYPFEKKWIKS